MIPITPQSRYDALVKLREGKIGREIFSDRMYPLTLQGLDKATRELSRKH